MAISSSCSTVKAVNSRWTSPSPSPVSKFAVLRRQHLLPELRYAPNIKLTATNALRTVEQTSLTEDYKLSTEGSDEEDTASLAKPRILIAEKLGEAGVNLLREFGDVDCSYELSPEDLKKKVAESDALIVRSGTKVTREVFEAAKGRLKVVGRAGVGIDNVDLQAATEYGCLVVNAPTANTVAAAEHGIALLASMARNVAQADASIKAGKWERSKYVGVSLVGKTLAVMGFGKVGTEVARRAKGLGMNVISHDPYAPADRARALGVDLVSFDQAIATADFVSLHMPLTPTTKKVFNDETFSKMKKGVRLINVARGGVIDEDALVRALDSGIVAQAALDVFCVEPPSKDSRLIQHENVTVTPHLGASTKEAQEGVAIEIAEAVAGALKGELSATAVNAPMVAPEVLSELAPYIVLAEKLGRLAVQLASGGKGVQSIKVVYRSARDRDDLDTRLLRAMITKGIIEPISDSYVNLVNADFVAKQKGLRISEERVVVESSPEHPVDSIQVQISNVESSFAGAVSGCGAISIEGRVKYGVPHLTCVGSFDVDVSLEGNLILCRQVDQPGMIGQVGNILGEQNVNVNFMSVGRKVVRAAAKMAVKDEWVAAAMTDDQIVVELLIRLKHAGTVVAENPAVNLPPLRWGIRQRRSRSSRFDGGGLLVSSKKDVDSARASPKTPLSWSGGSGSGGSSASPSAATADGFEDTSRQASCSTSTGSGSKAFPTNEITSSFSKRLRKKKSSSELKEEENLKLKERRNLEREMESLRATFNEQNVRNQRLKRIKLDYNSGRVKNETQVHKSQPESKACRVKGKTASSENQESFFFLPDLNMVPSEDEILYGTS